MTEPGDLAAAAPALRTAARRFGTPLYLTDATALVAAADELRAAFPDPWIRQYSVKANDVVPIVARLGAAGLGANVVSRGEWAIARRAGIPDDRITLEGIGKTDADLRAAVRTAADGTPLRWVAVESADEAATLAGLARRAGVPALDVLLRFNPAVEPETQRGLAVGAGASKFGLADDELAAAIEAGGADGPLRWRGIHLHVGSQLGAVDAWRDAVRRALVVGAVLGGGLPDFDTLDVGGGFPVSTAGEAVPRPERFARELPALLEAVPADRRPIRLAIEPGRFLVAGAGWLVASVLHVRERDGRMAILDAGMTELIRPALYGARHSVVALTSLGEPIHRGAEGDRVRATAAESDDPRSRPSSGRGAAADDPVSVHGPICESTDELGVHPLPPLRRGDLVAIRDAGAYAASLASTYNGRPRPPQVILEPDGRLSLARRRGTMSSLG
jgi:diaminopimelate decarboxylase